MTHIVPYGRDTVMSVAEYVALNCMLRFLDICVNFFLQSQLPKCWLWCQALCLVLYLHYLNHLFLLRIILWTLSLLRKHRLEQAPRGRLSENTGYQLRVFPLPHICCCGSSSLHISTHRWYSPRIPESEDTAQIMQFTGFQAPLFGFLASGLPGGKAEQDPSSYPASATSVCWKPLICENKKGSGLDVRLEVESRLLLYLPTCVTLGVFLNLSEP